MSDKSRGPEAKFVLTEYLDRHFAVGKLSYPELFSAVFVGWSYDQAINVMGLKVADIGKHFSGRTKVYHMIGIAGSTDIRPLSFATAFRWSQIINIEFSKLIVTVQNKLDDEIKRRGLDLKP